jgi:hypothetical protein
MLLTDFCNRLTTRAPVDRLAPVRVAFASPTTSEIEREPFSGAAPAHLSVTQPRVERA